MACNVIAHSLIKIKGLIFFFLQIILDFEINNIIIIIIIIIIRIIIINNIVYCNDFN